MQGPPFQRIDVAAGHLEVHDLGRCAYAPAYQRQAAEVERILASREANGPLIGSLLLVEHDPVITISNRPTAAANLTATAAMLVGAGVTVEATDRGGDITYHGPGQLVAYPILDLNRLHLRLHDYMRLLEETVIGTLADHGIAGQREPGATGVWVGQTANGKRQTSDAKVSPALQPFADSRFPIAPSPSKIAAMGVRIRRWVSMHGLALNVNPDLSHFDLIVPCGLAGRRVTSMAAVLGAAPEMGTVKATLVKQLAAQLDARR